MRGKVCILKVVVSPPGYSAIFYEVKTERAAKSWFSLPLPPFFLVRKCKGFAIKHTHIPGISSSWRSSFWVCTEIPRYQG